MTLYSTPAVISLLIGTGLPLLVAVVTKQSWNAAVKAAILLALASASATLSQWLDAIHQGARFDWRAAVLVALGTFVTAAGAHYQLWKPSGASAALQSVVVKDAPTGPPLVSKAQAVQALRIMMSTPIPTQTLAQSELPPGATAAGEPAT